MRKSRPQVEALRFSLLGGTLLVACVGGCSGGNSAPPADIEVRRKSKQDDLNKISVQPKARKSKGAPSKEDLF